MDDARIIKHGLKFMHAMDNLILLVGSGDDAKLVEVIHGVILL